MAIQFSTVVRNALLDAWETSIGVSVKVELRTGVQAANTAAPASGTLLAVFSLGADWAGPAVNGSKSLLSLPAATVALAPGAATHYRLTSSDGTVCHEHGSVTATAMGGDMTVDNPSIAANQNVYITQWTKTAPGV